MSNAIDRLTLLANFVRIAARGSISAAARDQGISQASASRQLATLEAQLGTLLVHRTTHALALTEAGQTCLREARVLLAGWNHLTEKLSDDPASGPLKVVAPVALGQLHLADTVIRFQQAHPNIALTWLLDDDPIRFAEIGCDLWIRVGPVPDDTLVLQTLGHVERMVVAAPNLLAQKSISTPDDLNALPCAALAPFEGGRITLYRRDDRQITITPPVALSTNNIFLTERAALDGLGFAILPKWMIAEALESGALVDILPDWRAASLPLNLACLPAPRQTKRLRLLRQTLQVAIAEIPGVELR